MYFAIFFLSFIFSYLIITLNFFPHLGFALTFLAFLLFSFKYKKEKDSDTRIYLLLALLFSIMLFIRSEPFITFLNLLASLFFGMLMLLPANKEKMGFADYIYANFLFLIKSVFAKSDYFLEFRQKTGNSKPVKSNETFFGILITVLLLVVVLPLLSSANPFFQKILTDFWNFLGLENLFKNIDYENLFIWLLRSVFFFFFVFIIPKLLTLMNKGGNYLFPRIFFKENLSLMIPKLILMSVLFIFFITQIQFYFADDQVLKNMGLSYSQHTREVFAQLSIVAGIVLLLIYNAKSKGVGEKIFSWILGVQGIFLTLMAFKSVFEYINAWGLTYKRLYGLTFATWILGIFILFFINFGRGNAPLLFVKKTIIFSGVIILLVNIFNFDYLIYHFKKAETGQGFDYTYLSALSPDSLSYKDQLLKLGEVTRKGNYSLTEYNNKNPLIIIHKIESLKLKYSEFDFRTVSLLEFLQYQQIKSEDTSKLRSYYESRFPLHRSML